MVDIIYHSTSQSDAAALKATPSDSFTRALQDLLRTAKSQELDPSSLLAEDSSVTRAFLKTLKKEPFWREKGDYEILEVAIDFASTIELEGRQLEAFLATFSANVNRHWIVVVPLASKPGTAFATNPIRRAWRLADDWIILPPMKSPRGFASRMKGHGSKRDVDERLVAHQALMTGYRLSSDAVLLFHVTGALRPANSASIRRFSCFRWLSDAFVTTNNLRNNWTTGNPEAVTHLLMLDTVAAQLHRLHLDQSISLPYTIDGRYRRAVSSPLFVSALDIFTTSETKLADRFRAAFYFFSRSFNEADRIVKFLFAMIALESLFSRDFGAPIKTTLADYAALVAFARHERAEIHNRIRTLYDLRSAIVHRGQTTVITESDEAERIAALVLVRSLRLLQRFNSSPAPEDTFFEYLRSRKLGIS